LLKAVFDIMSTANLLQYGNQAGIGWTYTYTALLVTIPTAGERKALPTS